MEQRLSLITLGVADLARSRRFYEQGLGWKRSETGSNENVSFYQLGGIGLSLFSRAALAEDAHLEDTGGGSFGGFTLAHNVRTREEVDALLARAKEAGARILKPAADAFWGGYNGYFADPDGHPWEVAWNPGFPLGPDGSLQLPK
ncbi:VOC family protein [Hyalangium rubrum]|uniref:VOC family protein n=1 Tax=Hyalangium rubrum TaxID=3103134 RepID=A0ABU5H8A3_9BACT|nr:VOC family protein [Hyalangium sp. s54d21]MDY7229700.1 VOC family protein [Hyalangium sp. s54d21]